MKGMLQLHRTYKHHDLSKKTKIDGEKNHFGDTQIKLFLLDILRKTKNLNVFIGNSVFSEEQNYRGRCVCTLAALLRPVDLSG